MGQKKKTLRDKPPAGLPAAQTDSVNTRTSRTGRVIKAPKAFTPPPTTVPTKKRKGGSRKKEANVVCIHCNRGHSPATNAIVFCDGCNNTWHQKCHDPPIDDQVILEKDMEWHCDKCKPAPRPKKDKNKHVQVRSTPNFHPRLQAGPKLEIGGANYTSDERRAYLSCQSHAQLVELVVKISCENPFVPMFPANIMNLPASQFYLSPMNSTTAASTTTASAPTKSSGKRTRAALDPSDDDVLTDPPKRSRTTSVPKRWKGDIPFREEDEPSDHPNASTNVRKPTFTTSSASNRSTIGPETTSTSQSRKYCPGYGYYFSSSSDDPTTSEDEEDEKPVADHRLYPKAGNGFAPALHPDDTKLLEEDPESQTFSHSMHGPAKEAKESDDPAPVWPSQK